MRFQRLFLTLGLIAVTAMPLAALAAPGEHGPGGPGGCGGPMAMPMMMILRHVNLTADQESQVHQIMQAGFTQNQPLMDQLHSTREAIADKLLTTGTVSAADLTPLQAQEAKIHQQLAQNMMATALKIRGVLTPDQLTQAATLHGKIKALDDQMRALMGDEPPPPPGE
jgi:Spy/CpxP family protein refolding chaperone